MVDERKVPEGYKVTEVGVIPEDWDVQSLGTNSILKARIGWQGLTTAEYLTDGEYYLITGTDFVNGRIDWDNCYYVEKQRYEQDRNIQVRKKDILVTKDGTIGKVAFIDQVMGRATLNSGVFTIRPLKSTYEPEYLYHILMSRVFRDFLDRLAAGSTISHLYQKDFVHFEFPIPSITEQKAIAEALSDTDNLIQSLENLIDKKKKIKQGAMQQLLTGEKRLPGFSGSTTLVTLDDILSLNKGEQLNRSGLSSKGDYPVINGGVEPSGYTDGWNTLENTITISEGGNSCGYVNYLETKFWSGGHAYTVKLKSNEIDQHYLYQLLKINESKIMALRVGSGLPNIQKKSLYEYKVRLVVDLVEQKAIAQVLSDMDTEIEALEEKLEKYKTIKQGMMQELLTGRIRLI